jgi:pyruvate/2-oxoglutarate dehydrogenase complex dihydrolipoamide dehydrogenase (E3) component
MQHQYDAIVIGSGQAGPFLAVRLAKAGYNTLLMERQHFGGTCLNDGCTPTKTLVASARAAHVVRDAARFGIRLDAASLGVDMKAVKARKDAIVDSSVSGLTSWLEDTKGLTLVRAAGRFSAPHTVEADGQSYSAPLIYINVGGRPSIPDIKGLDAVDFLTNTSMMELDVLPEHLVIIGGSYIALEFGQMYRRFGSKVTILEHGERLIGREDADVSEAVRQILEGEGISVCCNAHDLDISASTSGPVIRFTDARGAHTLNASHLLVATGRTPNTDDLGCTAAGLKCDAHGYLEVDDRLETSVAGVYALGDVNGHGAFTHTSYNDFEIVAGNLLDGRSRRVSDRVPTYALYIDPPLGRAGLTESEVRRSGRAALIATMPMKRVSRARERGEEQGFMKVLVDANTQQILGASLLGIEADEVIQLLLLAISAKLPYHVVRDTMGIHPTVSELLPSLFDALKPLETTVATARADA